jgi:peptide methionine sulfoxide reductase MsrB
MTKEEQTENPYNETFVNKENKNRYAETYCGISKLLQREISK